MNNQLGDRMKYYEKLGATEYMMPDLPVIVRLDGRAFHSFTQGLTRPYDTRLVEMMVQTATAVAEEANARIAYTQSDEITLVLLAQGKSQLLFNGRRDKLNSVLAATASVHFNKLLPQFIPEKAGKVPVFDCRSFTVPSTQAVADCLLWREMDATRNAISAAAHAHFSHRSLQNYNCNEMQERLFREKGINFNDYPRFFKRGTYIQRRKISVPFTAEEIAKLPAKHAARTNPGLLVERQRYVILQDMPRITQVLNVSGVVFDGEEPFACNIEAFDKMLSCVECGQPTMHAGDTCYTCCQKSTSDCD